ncbi:MAG TPA: ABC transporter substrate-binding protein [Acidimicrobiales bacterium]|nr:ABC transporter substrate-binding protein [Acidimicrobiales bacterium]
MGRRYRKLGSALASAAVVLAGVGVVGAGQGAAGAASVRGVTAKTIKVDILATLTGPQGPPFPGLVTGAKARINAQNKAGGVAGRKIVIVNTLDDAGSATTNAQQVRAAVQQDGVFAMLATSNAFGVQSTNFLSANKVPFLGWGYVPGYCNNPWGYGFSGCLTGQYTNGTAIVTQVAKADGGKKVTQVTWGFQSANTQASTDGMLTTVNAVKALKGKVVYQDSSIPGTGSTTDYSPYVSRLMAAHPDIAYMAQNFADVIGMTAALKAAGFTGPVANATTYVPGLLAAQASTAQALQGAYVASVFPPQEGGGAAIKAMQTQLKAIGKPATISLGDQVGYWSADMLIAMLKKVGKNLTPATFNKTINKGWTYTPALSGSIGAVKWPASHKSTVSCAAILIVKGTAYTPKVPYGCYPSIPSK